MGNALNGVEVFETAIEGLEITSPPIR